MRRFDYLADKHDFHRAANGFWAYRSDGGWCQFHDDRHFAKTMEAMPHDVAFFSIVFDMPVPAGVL